MRYLLLLPLFLLSAVSCSNDLTLPSDDQPKAPAAPVGMGPTGPLVLPKLIGCDGLPNVGNLWKVETTPGGIVQIVSTKSFHIAAIRDNAGVPGFQNYCEDTSLGANIWPFPEAQAYITTYCTGSCSDPRNYTANIFVPFSGTKRLMACARPIAGGSCVGTARDTVWVDDI